MTVDITDPRGEVSNYDVHPWTKIPELKAMIQDELLIPMSEQVINLGHTKLTPDMGNLSKQAVTPLNCELTVLRIWWQLSLSGHENGTLCLWDFESKQCIREFIGHSGPVGPSDFVEALHFE